jgi:hypothetical protein
MGSLKKLELADSLLVDDSRSAEQRHAGAHDRDQLEFFITGSLKQLIPDEHVLVQVDHVLDTGLHVKRGTS